MLKSLESLVLARTVVGLALPSGRTVQVASWVVRFRPANGPALSDTALARTYTAKGLVDLDGEILFGELAIVRLLERDGWRAVWADTFHGRKFWRDMPDRAEPIALPVHMRAFYDRVAALKANASPGGCFDVLAWTSDHVLAIEYKGPRDRPNLNEAAWLDAALTAGLAEDHIIFLGSDIRGQ